MAVLPHWQSWCRCVSWPYLLAYALVFRFLNIVVWIGKSTLWLVAYCFSVHAFHGRTAIGHGHIAYHCSVPLSPLWRPLHFAYAFLAPLHSS